MQYRNHLQFLTASRMIGAWQADKILRLALETGPQEFQGKGQDLRRMAELVEGGFSELSPR